MKQFVLCLGVLVSFAGSSAAFAVDSMESEQEKVIAYWDSLRDGKLSAGDNRLLRAEIRRMKAELVSRGFRDEGRSSAAILGGGCGFAGCDTSYLVTTPFTTRGANTRLSTLAGVVETHTRGGFTTRLVRTSRDGVELIDNR